MSEEVLEEIAMSNEYWKVESNKVMISKPNPHLKIYGLTRHWSPKAKNLFSRSVCAPGHRNGDVGVHLLGVIRVGCLTDTNSGCSRRHFEQTILETESFSKVYSAHGHVIILVSAAT